jgi:hypothetical protein
LLAGGRASDQEVNFVETISHHAGYAGSCQTAETSDACGPLAPWLTV